MTETFDYRQLTGLSESQCKQLQPNGQIMACMRELATLNQEW